MPAVLQITNDDISYAEGILLPEGKVFDDERRDFIRNFGTIDLQAVPGSGKTTALLAKLLILEKFLPFEDGRGVLVISHTNAAVDEIKEKIYKYCPKLFGYPNFIGTIQNFVDEFLAVPFYVHHFKNRPLQIDNDAYLYQFRRECPRGTLGGLMSRYRSRSALNAFLLKIYAKNDRDYIFDSLTDIEIRPGFSKTTNMYQDLRTTKLKLIKDGYLNFDDAYCLARQYIEQYPHIKSVIQKRFKCIFVDEMQDMDTHQYKLLEDLFMAPGTSTVCYQRIGDKNQAIFNGDAGDRNLWQDRETILQLNGSHRLTPLTAQVVQGFALYPIQIHGLRANADGTAIQIRPKIIVYDDQTATEVIDTFIDIIQRLRDSGQIPNADNVFYAVSWNTTWSDEENADRADRVRLIDYYPAYIRRTRASRRDYSVLEAYIPSLQDQDELKDIQDNIIRSLLKILSIEEVKDAVDRNYTKSSLFRNLREHHGAEFEALKRNLYLWSMEIVRGRRPQVISQIRAYAPRLLDIFGRKVCNSAAFINTPASGDEAESQGIPVALSNMIINDEIKVRVGTVHSVKGQTHTATLYLESYFGANSADVYESQRLREQFSGAPFGRGAGVRVKQSAKMVYVGLSRPTHLVCFAVHKDRYIPGSYSEPWEIVDIATQSREGIQGHVLDEAANAGP